MKKGGRENYTLIPILAIVAACILTRLPQLFSPNLVLDEDECVVGLMAKHMIEGKEVTAFFWGQVYGFSLIETAVIAVFYKLFGFGDIAVKLAMLSMFTAGVIFFYKALSSLSGSRWLPLIITALLICSPAWAAWSMKARGGYLSAFLLSSVLLWILFRQEKFRLAGPVLGVIAALIFYCQPLWLPGLFCLLFGYVWQERAWARSGIFLAGALPVVVVLEIVKKHTYTIWSPKVFSAKADLRNACRMLYDHLHGYIYLDEVFAAPLSAKIFAGIFIALILSLAGLALGYCFRRLKAERLFIFSVASILVTFLYGLFIVGHPSRYLLPISGFVLFALFLLLRNRRLSPGIVTGLLACSLPGAVAVVSFRDFRFLPYTKAEMLSTLSYLERQGIDHVFSNDVPQEWQIMFYSHERIICRESNNVNRYPEYTKSVNEAYKANPASTAVVDFSGDLKDMAPRKTVTIAKRFYVTPAPSTRLLKDMDVKW
ncbi:MAG: hypothetical protein JSS82_05795 [Bacteroidetes bacterium]|nr:hypothetical protein [Bacteroidota bacterium]